MELALSIASENTTDVSCFGDNDGSIDLEVVGGNPNYVYTWSDGSTEGSRSGLAPGTYDVTIQDDNGSGEIIEASYTIDGPSSPLVIDGSTVTNASNGNNNGSIAIDVSGGTAINYMYNWSNGGGGPVIGNLAPGTYTVVVTDDNGCDVIQSLSLIHI